METPSCIPAESPLDKIVLRWFTWSASTVCTKLLLDWGLPNVDDTEMHFILRLWWIYFILEGCFNLNPVFSNLGSNIFFLSNSQLNKALACVSRAPCGVNASVCSMRWKQNYVTQSSDVTIKMDNNLNFLRSVHFFKFWLNCFWWTFLVSLLFSHAESDGVNTARAVYVTLPFNM